MCLISYNQRFKTLTLVYPRECLNAPWEELPFTPRAPASAL